MKVISHRGNIRGSIPEKENRPSYIDCAIGNGFNVEVDLRFIDGEYWLGHDAPDYKVNINWLNKRKEYLWIHCKNLNAAIKCKNFNSFCHTNDPYIYTSNNKLWVHDLKCDMNSDVIIPLINIESIDKLNSLDLEKIKDVYAICTDYVYEILDLFKS